MELESVVRELAKLAIHKDNTGTVETDHIIDILKRLFPHEAQDRIATLVQEALHEEEAIARTGARTAAASSPANRRF